MLKHIIKLYFIGLIVYPLYSECRNDRPKMKDYNNINDYLYKLSDWLCDNNRKCNINIELDYLKQLVKHYNLDALDEYELYYNYKNKKSDTDNNNDNDDDINSTYMYYSESNISPSTTINPSSITETTTQTISTTLVRPLTTTQVTTTNKVNCNNIVQCESVPHYDEYCNISMTTLVCPSDYYIMVVDAFYGRLDLITCPDPLSRSGTTSNTNCYINVLNSISSQCNNNNICSLVACNREFTDPCEGTYKYLHIDYVCINNSFNIYDDIECNYDTTTTDTTTTSKPITDTTTTSKPTTDTTTTSKPITDTTTTSKPTTTSTTTSDTTTTSKPTTDTTTTSKQITTYTTTQDTTTTDIKNVFNNRTNITNITNSNRDANNDPYDDNATRTSVIILVCTLSVLVGYIIIRFIVMLVKKYKKNKISNYKY